MPFIPDEQPQEEKKTVLSGLADFAGRVITSTSDIAGGIIKSGREFREGTFQAPNIPGGKFIAPPIVGAVRGLSERKSVLEELPKFLGIKPESPAGIGVGLAGEIATPDIFDVLPIAKVAKKISKSAGEAFEKVGERLVLRGIKPTKTQLSKFAKQTGQELGEFVSKKNLAGNVFENVVTRINKVQGEYDDIVQNSGVMVKVSDIVDSMDSKIDALQAGLFGKTNNKSAINLLNKMRDEAVEKISTVGESINLNELVNTRRALDAQIPKSAWAKLFGGEDIPGKLAVRNILQDVINDSAEGITGGSGIGLRQLGKELQGLYSVEKIADLQSKLGKGSSIMGLQTGLGLIAGGVTGESVPERVKNAVLTAVGVNFANNSRVISALSNLVTKGSKIIGSKGGAKFIELILRAGKEDVITGTRPPEEGFIPDSQ